MPKRDNNPGDSGSDLSKKRRKLIKKLKRLDKKKWRRQSTTSSTSDSDNSGESIQNSGPNEPDVVQIHDGNEAEVNSIMKQQEPTSKFPELTSEILKLFGEEPAGSEPIFGEDIHQVIADRWNKYLVLGLEKAERDELNKKYCIPKNVPFLRAPILNPELEASISDASKKDDKYLNTIQSQLGMALTSLGQDQTPSVESTFPGGYEIIRQAFLRKGILETAIPVMIKSLSSSTLQQYSTTLKKWWRYCLQQKIEIYNANVGHIISFLNEVFETDNVTYSTINAHKSALSLIQNNSSSEELLIKRFLKGVFKIKPNFPRYSTIWDPIKVFQFIEKWGSLNELTLEKLVKKLVILLLLASGQRIQTISKINIKNISQTDEGIVIYISDIIKTSNPHREQPTLKFKFFRENPNLCVATTLLKYLDVTKILRKNEEYLILTHKRPIHKASTQSISRWVRDVLDKSGIDTKMFKSHSTRHASTSAAYRSGVSIDIIRNTVGWTKHSKMFAKFYNRPLQTETNFVEAVTNRKSK